MSVGEHGRLVSEAFLDLGSAMDAIETRSPPSVSNCSQARLHPHAEHFGRRRTMSKRNETTSPKVASKAAKILASPKSSKAAKSVAGSALTQVKPHKRK